MSVSIVLVPLALAAIGAWQAARQEVDHEGRTVCHVQTRMKDQSLLGASLRDTQAVVTVSPSGLVAHWQGVEAEFVRDEQGVLQAHFSGEVDAERASTIVAAIDAAYGRRVQQEVLARIRSRVPLAGMSLASETVDEDGVVSLVLNVGVRG